MGKKVQIFIEETGKQLAVFGSKTLTKLFPTIKGKVVDVFIQQPGEMKSLVGKYTVQGDVSPPPEPGPDKAPVIDAGQDLVTVEGATVTIDGSGKDDGKIINVLWEYDPEIAQHVKQDPNDKFNLIFTAPDLLDTETARGFLFRLTVEDDKSNISVDTCLVTVTQKGELPPPPPPPTTGKLLYSSNEHGKWNNGVKRIVKTSEGNVGPDGKGLYTAASGNPELHIDGDGIAHLVTGSGGMDNISLKLLSRHQEGGDGPNRGGGEGWSLSHTDWDSKRERYHNVHVDNGGGNAKIADYVWYSGEFLLQHEGNGIHLTGKYGEKGKTLDKVMDLVDKSPDAWFLDKALNGKNSYFWIRGNNADHGRIYIMAINWDSVLKLDFMLEPKENSIALRDVTLEAL